MTRSKATPNDSKASNWWEDFLKLPNRSRAARLIGPAPMPLPLKAEVHDGSLTWTWYDPYESDGRRKAPILRAAPASLCFDFARLGQASDEQIRRFADRWGPLHFDSRPEESLATWRRYARLAQALLRFTAELSSGGLGDEEDWRVICQSTPAKDLERLGLSRGTQIAIVAAAVNTWFAQARGHGILAIQDNDLQVRPYASNLFGVLVTQIAHVIARSDQKAVCAGCRNTFRPTRPIVRGSRQYCDVCRKKGVPQRDASRDWRRRARESQVGPKVELQPSAKQNFIRIETHGGSAAGLARCHHVWWRYWAVLLKRRFKPKALLWWSRGFPYRLLCCSSMVPSVLSSAGT
jgi:hypothetical protein